MCEPNWLHVTLKGKVYEGHGWAVPGRRGQPELSDPKEVTVGE